METIVALGLLLGGAALYNHATTEDTASVYDAPGVVIPQAQIYLTEDSLPSLGIHRADYKKTPTATKVNWIFTN